MKNFGLLAIALTLAINFLPSYAEDDLDQECIDFCIANGSEDTREKGLPPGHYLPQEPGAACQEGFTQDEENQICCCK